MGICKRCEQEITCGGEAADDRWHLWCWEFRKLGILMSNAGISKYKKIIEGFKNGITDWEYSNED